MDESLCYFGTDGIRGRVGESPINEPFCVRLGHALAHFLDQHYPSKTKAVVIGRDTRASGVVFAQCLQQALLSHGITVHEWGIVPTPAVAKAVRDLSAALGIVVTASHNPATDNGIKLFDHRGMKFSCAIEMQIEQCLAHLSRQPSTTSFNTGAVKRSTDSAQAYIDQLCAMLPAGCLAGWTVVLDTAHGATVETSPAVLQHFSAELVQLGNAPDGHNINAGVGSEHPTTLAAEVKRTAAQLGIAHDGDGDRLIICDELGSVLAGEEVLGLIALDALERNLLTHHTLVTTVHSNMGLDNALRAAGGRVERVAVGDRNIVQCMLAGGYAVGGEPSGHYIFFNDSVTGDGLLAAVKVIEIMVRTKRPLFELRTQVQLLPQVTFNLAVIEKLPLQQCARLRTEIAAVEHELGATGRLLVRYSGTEPKLRLLVEGQDKVQIAQAMDRLVAVARLDLKCTG